MPKLTNEKIIQKFKERFEVLKAQGKVENINLTDNQILINYEMMNERQTERYLQGEITTKNTLRETLELFKKGKSSYWQLKSSQKIAKNLLGSGYEFSEEEKTYLESVERGRQSNNFRKKGREKLFEIVERVNEWYENSSNDANIDRQAHYAIFGS